MIFSIIVAIIVLSIIIFIHELGHFTAAKLNGIKVLEFGMGIPPRMWGKKIGETIYSINWLPFGGFVRMLGQNDLAVESDNDALKDPRHFENKSAWARTQVILAGVFMNFLCAIIVLAVLFMIGTKPMIPGTTAFDSAITEQGVIIKEIIPDSQASISELQVNDIVTKTNETEILSSADFQDYVTSRPGETISLTVTRLVEEPEGTEELIIPVTVSEEGVIGVSMVNNLNLETVQYGPVGAVGAALEDTKQIVMLSLEGFGLLLRSIFTEAHVPDEVAGPVGIVRMTGDVAQMGFSMLLYFMAIISISIGLINILPLPALDGGRFLFIIYEVITRSKPNRTIEGKIHLAGFLFLIGLIIVITINDITQIPAIQNLFS